LMLNAMPSLRGTPMKGSLRLTKKMARSASLDPVDRFIANCTYLDEGQKSDLYAPEFRAEISGSEPASQHRAAFGRVDGADFLHQMLYLDSKIFMTSLNLTYNDKMSMASSVEVRVPFLDRELAEFVAWNVPPRLKLKGFWKPTTKYILRKAMADVLPREVLQQPKAGFAAPVDYWLAHDLKEMVDDLLSSSQVRKRSLFRPEAVRHYVEEHRSGRRDWSMQLWQFLTLELWMQTFLDGGAAKFEPEMIPSQAATA
jgi:asparagine synthase (glutamine-hydrolysing)